MPRDIYFRTSLTGYNKSDVISFIEKLNNEQVTRVNELNEKIRLYQVEQKRLLDELEEERKKSRELADALSETDENRIANDDKARKYDAMQETYADIMLDAERTSKEKLKFAEEESQKIINDANTLYEERTKELEALRASIFSENKRILETSKAEITSLLDKLTSQLEEGLTKVELKENDE